jgi:membrane protein implicated in regulation of membrane protease activity
MPSLIDLYATYPYWVWLAAGAALLALEVATGSGWLLWPSGTAAFMAALTRFAELSFPQAAVTYAVLTIVVTLLARRYVPRSLTAHGHDINDNIHRLMGHHGEAVGSFKGRAGRVFIDGKEWAAELEEAEGLEAGARVEVTGVHGARLKVRPA